MNFVGLSHIERTILSRILPQAASVVQARTLGSLPMDPQSIVEIMERRVFGRNTLLLNGCQLS
jgi:hypothetical protein